MIYVGKEEISQKNLDCYLLGQDTLSGVQLRAIVAIYNKKIVKGLVNDSFDPNTKLIMESLGFRQDREDYIVEGGEAKASVGNRLTIAEGELVAAKGELTTASIELVEMQKALSAITAKHDKLKAGIEAAKKADKPERVKMDKRVTAPTK